MDQVKEQLAEAETKIKEAQLKRLQKKLIGMKKEVEEAKKIKEVSEKVFNERLENFIGSVAFGQVYISEAIENIPYKKLVETLRSQQASTQAIDEPPVIVSELNSKLEKNEITFQKSTASIDQENFVFYEDPMEGKEIIKFAVRNTEVTDFNYDYADNDGSSILLLVAEINPSTYSMTDPKFYIMKIRDYEVYKWSYAFGLQDYFTKKRVSRISQRSDFSIPQLRNSIAKRIPEDPTGFLRPPNREDLKIIPIPSMLSPPEESKSDKIDEKHSNTYEELLFEPLTHKSKSEESDRNSQFHRLSPSQKLSLAPIIENAEGEQPTVDNKIDNNPSTIPKQSPDKMSIKDETDTESFKNALETPMDDLVDEESLVRGASALNIFDDNEDKGEMSLQKAQEILKSGSVFKKYGRLGQPHYRYVWLNNNKISWKNIESNTLCDSIQVSSIQEIIEGRNTPQFKRFPKVGKTEEASSFTIKGIRRTLDLEANEPKRKERFVKALRVLIENVQSSRYLKKSQTIST